MTVQITELLTVRGVPLELLVRTFDKVAQDWLPPTC